MADGPNEPTLSPELAIRPGETWIPTTEVNRFVLPIHDPQPVGITTYDAKDPDTSFPPITEPRPPAGAPNVLIVLLDDIGFGASSAFGGAVNTPTAERLAAGGIKLSRFHTTALCAPTRAALLTGRNHHTVGMGSITETATSRPGTPRSDRSRRHPLAEILKQNGYSTAQFGKCHEVPVWKTSPVGPFDLWPTGSGFDYFYGFIGGETNQYYPALYEGTTPVEPPSTPAEGYHLTDDLTDKAIAWFRQQRSLQTDKPFFAYFAPGATHAPHHVAPEWSDKYRGRFDAGWDVLRERGLRPAEGTGGRSRPMPISPPDPRRSRPGTTCRRILKPVLARQMEVYAGFLEHTDHAVGRVIDELEELGVLDDTLVYYIIGDNGASAEGTPNGTFNELFSLNGAAAFETAEFMAANIDKFGTPEAYNHYAVGWAHAMCTPYQWTKQVASHFGGTRNGTIVHWPNGFAPEARCVTSSTTSSTWPRPSSMWPISPSPRWSTVRAAAPPGDLDGLPVRRRRSRRAAGVAVLRDGVQPWDVPQGLDGGYPAQRPLAVRSHAAGPGRRRMGAVRHHHRLDPGP